MIGDSVEADIKGGKAAGLFSILISEANVQPAADCALADLVVPNVTALLGYFAHRP
jgi:ribonucleotide monophosphatase NagD (HAD superfamily)